MDTRRLRHFLAVFETGSICQAATTIHLTQPALTKSIKQLEELLGVQLFDRTPLGVVPTVFAEALAPHAKAIQTEIRAAEMQLSLLSGSSAGHVIVGIGPSIAANLMPLLTAHLYKHKPGIRVTVVEGLLENIIPAVRCGELDLAITAWPSGPDPDLTSEVVFRDQIAIICGYDHPLAARQLVTAKELLDFPWALPSQKVAWRHYFDQVFTEEGLAPPIPTVTSTSAIFLRALLQHENFLSFLPRRLVLPEEEAGSIVSLPVANSTLNIDVTLTYRHRTALTPAARSMIHVLRELIASGKFTTE